MDSGREHFMRLGCERNPGKEGALKDPIRRDNGLENLKGGGREREMGRKEEGRNFR